MYCFYKGNSIDTGDHAAQAIGMRATRYKYQLSLVTPGM